MPSREEYTVGWISALPLEMAAAQLALDVVYEASPVADAGDDNLYTMGSVSGHLVVLACLPGGMYGTNSAATVATQMKRTFTSLRYFLVVGIAGGVPSSADICLGDVVVSQPTGMAGGVVQYDLGKRTGLDRLETTGWSFSPPRALLTVVSKVKSLAYQGRSKTGSFLSQILDKDETGDFAHPGGSYDLLFAADYEHPGGRANTFCDGCDRTQLILRPPRAPGKPKIHYGTIASGNQVMRDGRARDRIARSLEGVLCFEMEAAGVVQQEPSLVIRGICDYADSHKNKIWQGYAAATAAAYAKELLSTMPPTTTTTLLNGPLRRITAEKVSETLGTLLLSRPQDDRNLLIRKKGRRVDGTCQWLASDLRYQNWLEAHEPQLLWLSGGPGNGKTMLAIYLTEELERLADSNNAAAVFFFCDTQDERRNTTVALLRGLLHQLLEQHPSLIEHIQEHFEGKGRAHYTVSRLEALWAVFRTALYHCELDEVWCVLDGVDECDEGSLKQLLECFKNDLAEFAAFHTRLKVLIISRPQPVCIEGILAGFPRLDLDDESNRRGREDVERYIAAKVNELRRRPWLDESDLREIERQLETSAGGTFLWIGFVAEELNTQRDSYGIRNVLKKVPRELGGIYRRILRRMKGERLFPRILHLVVLARQPLTLAELAAASDIQGSPEDPPVTIMQSILGSWESLLRIVGETVQLIHGSAKDFLLSDGLQDDAELEIFQVREEKHLDMVRACLDALEGQGRSSTRVSSNRTGYPLLAYASSHWFEHLTLASNTIESNDHLSREFFRPGSRTRERWWSSYWSQAQFGAPPTSFTLLHLAAYFGVTAWVEILLRKNNSRLLHRRASERKDSYGRTPLSWAASRGHGDVVKLLLKNNSKINTNDKDGLTPLHIATTAEHGPVVQLLLDNKADIEAKDVGGNTPLARAIENGSKEMVILLLNRGAERNYLLTQAQLDTPEGGVEETAQALLAHNQGELLFRRFEGRFEFLEFVLKISLSFLRFKPTFRLFTKIVDYQLEKGETSSFEVLRNLVEKHRSTGLRRAGKPVIAFCEKVIDRKDIQMLSGLLVVANKLFEMALAPGCEALLELAAFIAIATLQRAVDQEFQAGLKLLGEHGSRSLTTALHHNKQDVLDQALAEALCRWHTAVSNGQDRDAHNMTASGWALYMAVLRDKDKDTIDHCVKLYTGVLQGLIRSVHRKVLFDDLKGILCKEMTEIVDHRDIDETAVMSQALLCVFDASDDDLLEFFGSLIPATLNQMLRDSVKPDTFIWLLGTGGFLTRDLPRQTPRVQVCALKSLVECMLILKRAHPNEFNRIWGTAQEALETAARGDVLERRDIDQVSFQVFGAQPFSLV